MNVRRPLSSWRILIVPAHTWGLAQALGLLQSKHLPIWFCLEGSCDGFPAPISFVFPFSASHADGAPAKRERAPNVADLVKCEVA